MDPRDKQAYMNATPMQLEVVRGHLSDILATLRAQYLSYQTSHWQVVGGSFYGNHLLFERLYKSVQDQVDQLAEKIVGYVGIEGISLLPQVQDIFRCTARWSKIGCHHKRGLASEAELQDKIKAAYDAIKNVSAMTLGLDDWLMATANAHESNTYLLQQALAKPPGKSANEGPGAKHFYDNPEKKEVLEFARTQAISNDVAVVEEKAPELDIPEKEAIEQAEEAPPLPVEIAKEPGGAAVSTLNRFVIKSEDPVAEKAVKMNQERMAAWLEQIS